MEDRAPKAESVYRCQVNTNEEGDRFVGIRSDDRGILVCFPLGYNLGETEKDQKKDIQILIKTLSRFSTNKQKLLPQNFHNNPETVNFPIHAYISVISEYMSRGYYTENEVSYKKDNRGKINWPRTIQSQKAYPQNGSFLYLNYVTKDTVVDDTRLITMVHEFCVYESFEKLGWLFTNGVPKKPRIRFEERQFLAIVHDKMAHTFNDKNKELFSSLIDIIKYMGITGENRKFYYGTDDFEYVWEKMIDFTYGIDEKKDYFPKTVWQLNNQKDRTNAPLEPDTIMISNNKVFVLDAKYYKFGATARPSHLPESSSVNKQITYGEYVATQERFKAMFGERMKVYNAFLMPFNREGKIFPSIKSIRHIGESLGDWKTTGVEYERVQGLLLDVKYIMSNYVKRNTQDICELAKLIEDVFEKNEEAEVSN